MSNSDVFQPFLQGDKFYKFLFAPLYVGSLSKMDTILKRKNLFLGEQTLLRVDSFGEGRQKKAVASLKVYIGDIQMFYCK